MQFKSLFRLIVPAGFLLISGNVLAASTVYAGSVCHNYESQDVDSFEYYGQGITNASNIGKFVICPIQKRFGDANGINVRVNVEGSSNTISCTLYSYNYNGRKLGSQTVRNRVSGISSVFLQTPFSTARSHFSVVCKLPANEDGAIYSVESLN